MVLNFAVTVAEQGFNCFFQAIREMELIDKKRTRQLEEMIAREEAKKSTS